MRLNDEAVFQFDFENIEQNSRASYRARGVFSQDVLDGRMARIDN
jgi:hypothetical protein